MNLHWLPDVPDFRAALKAAVQLGDGAPRMEALASLAAHRIDALQTMQLDRELSRSASQQLEGWARVRLAVLASHTVEHLLPGIRVAGLRHRVLIDTYCCSYGQYRQDIVDPSSPLHSFSPQFILLAVSSHDVLHAADSAAAAAAVAGELRDLWGSIRQGLKATIIQQTFLDLSEPLLGHFDRLDRSSPSRGVAWLNDTLAVAAREDGVLLLDVERLAARDGRDNWFEAQHWFASKLMIAPRAAPAYGENLARIVAARLGRSRKCLVLDLDNTVWGGVVGDDGIQGLVLGQGSARGEAHLSLQRYARQLRDRGVILAVCSKNDRAIAEAAFSEHPEMLLKMRDIAAFVANWEDKAANLESIARQLNIGLDSLVFVDDNPAERRRVRMALPRVGVPELPDDVAGYVRAIADAGYFEATNLTEEDRSRGELYAANSEREDLRGRAQSMDEFRRDLGMTLRYGRFAPVDLARVTQLINKTNQFNVTVRRHSQQGVEAIAAEPGSLALQFRLADRFGDNGLIAAMMWRAETAGALALDTWVMSCRVFGREVEFEIMNIAARHARALGCTTLHVDYSQTDRNGLVRDLLPRLGFVENGLADDGKASRWSLELASYAELPTHIKTEAES